MSSGKIPEYHEIMKGEIDGMRNFIKAIRSSWKHGMTVFIYGDVIDCMVSINPFVPKYIS